MGQRLCRAYLFARKVSSVSTLMGSPGISEVAAVADHHPAAVPPLGREWAGASPCDIADAGISIRFGHWLLAFGLVAACVLVAGNAWADLSLIGWRDEEASHVLLVPFMVVWLAWLRKHRLRDCRIHGRWVGALGVGLGWLLWSAGYRYQIQSFWHAGAIVMAVGGILTALGKDVLLKFLPVFAVLLFLIPVPATGRQAISVPLQRATAAVTQNVCEVLGMHVVRHGSLLSTGRTEVAIAEACNGMRMVFTLFLACYVFAFVNPLRPSIRGLILLLSPVVALACNVVRLVPTVWMFGHVSHDAAERFHTAAGWLMLGMAFAGLTGIVRVLRWSSLRVDTTTEEG